MLEDRYYMRRPAFRPQQSATIILIVANVAAFIAQAVLQNLRPALLSYLPLTISGLKHGFVWQLLSFQFLHAGVWHLLFNCLAIFWFGRSVEEALGRKSFYTLYFASGIIGGLVQALTMILMHPGQDMAVVGASAGAFGVTAAYALLFPDAVILLFFVLPVPARALLLFEAGFAIAGIFGLIDPVVAHAAHLGGMLTGVLFVRYAVHWRIRWPQITRPRARAVRRLVKVPSQKPSLWAVEKPATVDDLPPEEFLSKEVDPILDKISAHGIQSLTERERRILEKARTKMAKR